MRNGKKRFLADRLKKEQKMIAGFVNPSQYLQEFVESTKLHKSQPTLMLSGDQLLAIGLVLGLVLGVVHDQTGDLIHLHNHDNVDDIY